MDVNKPTGRHSERTSFPVLIFCSSFVVFFIFFVFLVKMKHNFHFCSWACSWMVFFLALIFIFYHCHLCFLKMSWHFKHPFYFFTFFFLLDFALRYPPPLFIVLHQLSQFPLIQLLCLYLLCLSFCFSVASVVP